MDEIKTIFILLFAILLLNSAKGETNAQNITIELHQAWDFSSDTDATVIDTIRTNEDWIIPGGINLQDSEIVNYFVYIDDLNSFPVTPPLYRPTTDNRVNVPDYNLSKNKTLISKYTILRASNPIKFFGFDLDNSFFPLDRYGFLLMVPIKDYNQTYSADIIFPASFEIKNFTISRPFIEQQQTSEGWTITIAGIGQTKGVSESSKNIEEYKYRVYVPSRDIPNSNSAQAKYFEHTQNPSKNGLILKFIYGRPTLFILIFFISIVFMLLVTYFFHPLTDKKEIMKYSLTIGSIWAAQEGASFLQGHRPLEWTLYDSTIFIIILIYIIFNLVLYFKKSLAMGEGILEERI